MQKKIDSTLLNIVQKIYSVFIIAFIFTIYNILLHLSLIYFVFYFNKRIKKHKETKSSIRQRFGFYTKTNPSKHKSVIIHCPSLGETNGASSFADQLQKIEKNIIITNTTLTGHNQSKKIFNNSIKKLILPLDFPFSIIRFLLHAKPSKIIIFESDLWPNFILICRLFRIKLYLVNGRVSKKSAKSFFYMYRLWQFLLKQFDLIFAYSKQDMQRIKLFNPNVKYLGNTKYYSVVESIKKVKDLNFAPQKQVLTCVSIHKTELDTLFNNIILPTHNKYHINIILRHPQESLQYCTKLLDNNKIPYNLHSKTSYPNFSKNNNSINIVDTFGEVLNYINKSDVAFIGGSLNPKIGGHNILEAVALKKPTITGEFYSNWEDIIDEMKNENAIFILDKDINLILENKVKLNQYVKNAEKFFTNNVRNPAEILNLIYD